MVCNTVRMVYLLGGFYVLIRGLIYLSCVVVSLLLFTALAFFPAFGTASNFGMSTTIAPVSPTGGAATSAAPFWSELTDVASSAIGGKIGRDGRLVRERGALVSPTLRDLTRARSRTGASGWTAGSTRKRPARWCIVALAAPTRVYGFEVDTAFFTGNQALGSRPVLTCRTGLRVWMLPCWRRERRGANCSDVQCQHKVASSDWQRAGLQQERKGRGCCSSFEQYLDPNVDETPLRPG